MTDFRLTFEQLISSYKTTAFDKAIFSSLFKKQIEDRLVIGRDFDKILHEIGIIETGQGKSTTKPAEQFKHPPLVGLWKKHFFSARFLAKNIENHWRLGNPQSEKLRCVIKKHAEKFGDSSDPAVLRAFSQALLREVVSGAYKDKSSSGRLTGEWIIFADNNGVRHYLTIASHDEGDAVIYEKIRDFLK